MKYVAAYTAGNDISSRKLQRDPALAGPVPQWGFSKGFDTWAPLGPALIRCDLIQDPAKLKLTTTVDGEIRQCSSLDDLIFGIPYLISYLSSGTTLQKGSVIMTGTPGGKFHCPTPCPCWKTRTSYTQCMLRWYRGLNIILHRCRFWSESPKISCPWNHHGGTCKSDWYIAKWRRVCIASRSRKCTTLPLTRICYENTKNRV